MAKELKELAGAIIDSTQVHLYYYYFFFFAFQHKIITCCS